MGETSRDISHGGSLLTRGSLLTGGSLLTEGSLLTQLFWKYTSFMILTAIFVKITGHSALDIFLFIDELM